MGEPVEVHVFGTRKYRLHRGVGIYYRLSTHDRDRISQHMVEIFNEKMGVWERYPVCEAVLDCPVCGRPMRCLYVPGTTWLACCSEECYRRLDEKAEELGGLGEAIEYFRRVREAER